MSINNFEEFKKDWNEVNDNILYLVVIYFWFFLLVALFTSSTAGLNILFSSMWQYVILSLILLLITSMPKRWGRNKTWAFLPRTLWRYYKAGKVKREELRVLALIVLFYLLAGFLLISTAVNLNTNAISLSTFPRFSSFIGSLDSALILFGSVLIFIFLAGFTDLLNEQRRS